MKAFLLAAGHGTRLRPLTNYTPKCLLPIRGTPMLEIWLELCHRFGIDEVLVNVHSQAALVRDFLRLRRNGVAVQLKEEQELLGSAGTLRANCDWIASESLFWIFYADVLTTADLGQMLATQRRHNSAATIGVNPVPDPSRCGIVSVSDNGLVESFVEKPEHPASNLAFSGLMIATPALIDAIPDHIPADIGFHVLPQLAGHIAAHAIHEYLIDIGTTENYRTAQETWPGL